MVLIKSQEDLPKSLWMELDTMLLQLLFTLIQTSSITKVASLMTLVVLPILTMELLPLVTETMDLKTITSSKTHGAPAGEKVATLKWQL